MKLKVLSIVLIASLLASILLIGIGSVWAVVPGGYWEPLKEPCPTIALLLQTGPTTYTTDLNVTGTDGYAVGSSFNVTVWVENVTKLDGFGITIVWNTTFEVCTAFNFSPKMTAESTAGNWTFAFYPPMVLNPPTGYMEGGFITNNATEMILDTSTTPVTLEPWTGVLPYNVGALVDWGGGTKSDKAPLSGNIELCILTFTITQIGPHGFYINKDPVNYLPWISMTPPCYTVSGNVPYLNTEGSVPPQYALPWTDLDERIGTEPTVQQNYTVVWSSNPYFAPPTAANPYMPYSGHLANAMLWIMPPPSTAPTASVSFTNFPFAFATVPITVTQVSEGFNGITGLYCPITNVYITYGDGGSSSASFTPPSIVFNHAWSAAGTYTINVDCYAAGMAGLGALAWSNITKTITVLVPVANKIDVYEVREALWPGDTAGLSGVGPGIPGRPYDPQALVVLEANVTYGGAPEAAKIVSFQINVTQAEYPSLGMQGACILFMTNETNYYGEAFCSFRIPNLYPNPVALFGKWTVYVTVSMCQVTYKDNMTFQVGYILTLSNMFATNSPTKRLMPITFNVTITNIDWTNVPTTMILVVYDNNEVPIGQVLLTLSVPGETPDTLVSVSTTYLITLPSIPWTAYVGTSMGYINLFDWGLPALGGLAFCPQASASFLIVYP